MKIAVLFFLIVAALLAACSGQAGEPAAIAAPTGVPPANTATTSPTAEPTAVPSPTPTLQPSPTPTAEPIAFTEPVFVFQGSDPALPIVSKSPTSQIKNAYINPGAVLYHDGKFHMFFNSFTNWPGTILIGYLTSEDGLNWTAVQEEPVFVSDQVPYGSGQADVSSVVVLEDGRWAMYFHTISGGEIGLATADGPLGPWEVAPQPVLVPGAEGAWDAEAVAWPSVVQTVDGYAMAYGGEGDTSRAIGMAVSDDGLSWRKVDDPQTAEPPFAESDPVLAASAEWENGSVDRPRIQLSEDGWAMIYAGDSVSRRGLALSNDGRTWAPYPANPVLTPDAFPIRGANTWDTALLAHDGDYYYYMEIGSLAGTNLFLTRHEGSLRP